MQNEWLYTYLPIKHEWLKSQALMFFNTHYEASNRKYHNLNHIRKCLELNSILPSEAQSSVELSIAILFHDVIYDVSASPGENEQKSADLCLEVAPILFKDGISPNINWKDVHDIIMSTVHSGDEYDSIRCRYMINFDLFELGASPKIYSENSENIKREYTSLYDNIVYNSGRIKFLTSMLNRSKIFYKVDDIVNDRIFDQMEIQARMNMKSELYLLKNPPKYSSW